MGDAAPPIRLASATDLNAFNYFTRGTIAEHLKFATRTVGQRTPLASRQSVGLKDNPFLVHCYCRADGLIGIVVSDSEYTQRVAYSLIGKELATFDKLSAAAWKSVETDQTTEPEWMVADMKDWQNPASADKIAKIQKELDEVKDIMSKNIEEVLKRGETLDSLMEKSTDLSATSLTFYKKAKKTNQCCKMY